MTVTSTRSKFARLSGSALVLALTDLPGLVLVLDVAGLPGRTPGRAFDLGIAGRGLDSPGRLRGLFSPCSFSAACPHVVRCVA